jgi:hypothetical protein
MSSKLDWSGFQKAIFEDVANGVGNTIIEAKAGSSKTTTLLEALKHIPKNKKIAVFAFNKSIKDELIERAPQYKNLEIMTLHSLGFRAIRDRFGKDVKFSNGKTFGIIKNILQKEKSDPKEKDDYESIYEFERAVGLCKNFIIDVPSKIDELLDEFGIDTVEYDRKDFISKIIQILGECKKDTTHIDFNDMIWFPFVYNLPLTKYDRVLVDECFPFDQYIATDKGKTKIGVLFNRLTRGEKLPLVKSYNETLEKFEFNKIINVWDRGIKKLIEIRLGKRRVRCTENHRFLTTDGWIKAINLKPGQLVKTTEPIDGQLQLALNSDQEQIVLGSFLGDGYISKVSDHRYRMKIIHGIAQKNYCDWKREMFNVEKLEYIEKNGYSQTPAVRFSTKTFSIKGEFPKNKHTCPQWILDKLDARGLAIWLMDDGSFGKSYARISTCSFDNESQERMVKKLKNFGINCKIFKCKDGYSYININANGLKCLRNIIAPFMHKNLSYKSEILKIPHQWNNKYKIFGYAAVDSVNQTNDFERVFDMEVENNHNFIVCSGSGGIRKTFSGLIAHNCQDLNRAQMSLIFNSLKENSRVFIFLDKFQAIYSWRGADTNAVQTFQERLNAKTLELPISYRCANRIIYAAQKYVPGIKPAPNAKEGEIINIGEEDLLDYIRPGDFLLSRTNAPLFKWCLKMLRLKIPANIRGKGLDKGLLFIIKQSKKKNIESFLDWLKKWEISECARLKEKNRDSSLFLDKIACLRCLCEGVKTTADLQDNIKLLFNEEDGKKVITCSTIHGIKGAEETNVFILEDTFRFGDSQEEQNLKYVAITRAKEKLYWVKS